MRILTAGYLLQKARHYALSWRHTPSERGLSAIIQFGLYLRSNAASFAFIFAFSESAF